ncbi:MAG: pilus assembly protein PilM [Gammaproteobacteria bacterium]|nr:pilus assembly protein PilM [Gammaproteobacteria bacterium]
MSIVSRAAALLTPGASPTRIGPIGIDFGLESVHLVQLESSAGKPPVVRARLSLDYDSPRREILKNPHQFRSMMKRALGGDHFYGRKAVIAIPSGMFRTISINYQSPGTEEQESAAVIRVMRDRLDGDLADYVLDYLPVKSRSKKDERLALVAVSERQPIVDFLELTRKARLNVEALEIGPVAISRLVGAMSLSGGSENVLVINSGRRASYLTVISGNDLLFDQEVAFGEHSLIQHVAQTLEMSDTMARDLIMRSGVRGHSADESVAATLDDAGFDKTMAQILKPQFMKLVEEIKRVCLYAASETRGGTVTRVYLLGSIARWPGTENLLGTLSGVQVEKIPDPLALFPSDEGRDPAGQGPAAPEIVVATGAALRGMQNDG